MRPKRKDDVVDGLDDVDARSILDDDHRSFVPEHHRQRQGPIPIHDVPVAHADAGRLHPDADLAAFRRLLVEVEYLKGFLDFHQNRKRMLSSLAPDQPDLLACRHLPHAEAFSSTREAGLAAPRSGGLEFRRMNWILLDLVPDSF